MTTTMGFDEVMTTTRGVRKRLDLTRPVERDVLLECLEIAQQAPNGSNLQPWQFVVVTDPELRAGLADIYRRATREPVWPQVVARVAATPDAVVESARHLVGHLHEVPVHVIPCVLGRTEGQPQGEQAELWGSILPATWSFMLALRSRGLGSVFTALHLRLEHEAAKLLGIPYDEVMQAGLVPVAYTIGTDFKPGRRGPVESMIRWDTW